MVTQGTSSRRHPALLMIPHTNIAAVIPSVLTLPCSFIPSPCFPPSVLFIWTYSEHIVTATVALSICHHNHTFCRNPATCVISLLLSEATFTDRAVFSIQGQRISHIFTVIAKCWHAGVLFFLSFSVGKQLSNLKTLQQIVQIRSTSS